MRTWRRSGDAHRHPGERHESLRRELDRSPKPGSHVTRRGSSACFDTTLRTVLMSTVVSSSRQYAVNLCNVVTWGAYLSWFRAPALQVDFWRRWPSARVGNAETALVRAGRRPSVLVQFLAQFTSRCRERPPTAGAQGVAAGQVE